jgi:tRNA threonylcarbamoyladenosine biosynthesis protein TsaB
MAVTILALDTTSAFASIALLKDEQTIFEYNFSSDDNLSAILIPSLEFLLKSVQVKLDDLDAFAAGIGPGLFTGLRVGLATIKGLNMLLARPVVPVVTLEALAYKCRETERPIVALIDARRSEVYCGAYRFDGRELQATIPACLIPFADLQVTLAGLKDPIFVGSGADVHRAKLRTWYKRAQLDTRSHFLACEIGKIAQARFTAGVFVTDMQHLLPLYLRKPDAELNYQSADQASQVG